MKKITLFIFTFLFHYFCFSQNWVNSAGGNFNDESYDVEVDNLGFIYTTGYITSSSVFGSSINLTTNGFSDIYVSKSDVNGNFLWAKVFGGTQADRGYDIVLDNSGNIYVTGYFIGTATFGSTTLTSNGNSQDIFVLKLDNTGNVLWAKSEGGSEGDTGYGVTVDNLGNVIVTGQFKGTAQIGSNTFSSAIDPNTGLPAYDIFISKYDASGNDLWSIQGTAKYDDRGLALKTDQNNNIYVTGQFSDTLTIAGSTQNNTIYNAGMLLKLDASGNEIWFKRLGAIQTLVYDLEIDNQGDIYITGDFLGQMIIIGLNGNNFLNGNYTYRIFLIKFDPDGNIIWMQEDDSNSPISSKAITLDANQDPYIAGIFKCVFNEYADTLGSGLFNAVGYNDVFITKYDKLGSRKWMRQYGGPLDDYCSGIAISQINNPIISGGYTEYFNYPVGLTFSTFSGINFSFTNFSWSTTCSVTNYKYLNAVGSKDIVIGKPVDLSIPHYFYYENTTCYSSDVPCIENTCPDSLTFCGNGSIRDYTHTIGNGYHRKNYTAYPNYHHGPYFDFLWSNGDTTNIINVNTSGNYWVKTDRIDGCLLKKDTVFVTVNPIPQLPHLTDDHGFNVQKYPTYNKITMCFPDTATTWFGNLNPTYQFLYTTPLGTTYTDSLPHQIYEGGTYNVSVVDTNNCVKSSSFILQYDYPIILDTIIPYILQLNDTICIGQKVNFIIADSITNPTGNLTMPYCSNVYSQSWNIGGGGPLCLTSGFYPTTSGWYNINSHFVLGYQNLCGLDTIHYFVQDSFYVEVLPLPTLSYNLGGDALLCPGDTVNIWTDTVVTGFNWTGPGILTVTSNGDSIFANQQGYYYYGGTITDSISGCSKSFSKYFSITVKPSPTIVSNVPDNIICPGDSILLTCQQTGIAYEWVGPQGNVIGNTQSIWVNVPGFYHCVLTDFDLCVLTSNTIELKEYNTPFILVDPGTELCHTGSIELTAIFTGSPSVQWQPFPPNSANDPSIVVNLPGTYYVEVTQCGFTVRDSVTITLANVNATITLLTDSLICPGDTAILTTNSGMGGYEWQPTSFFGQTLLTTDTGYYYVTITESSTGCTAVSDTVHIGYHSGGTTPDVQNITICIGDTASLINLNSGLTTNWYADSITTTPFITGNNIELYNITNDTIIYVENFDSNCTSPRVPVSITISQASITPAINGNDNVCYGDTLQLSTPSILNGNYNWSGPNGFSSNQNPIIIANADTNNAGVYTLSVSDGSCSSSDTIVLISILPQPQITINSTDTVWKCLADTVLLLATGNYQNISWSNGSVFDSTYVFIPGEYYAIGLGINGCSIISDTVYVMNFVVAPPQLTDTTICYGDSVQLSSSNNLTLNWYDIDFTLITVDSIYQTPVLFNSTYYYTTYIDSIGCESPSSIINVYVIPANGSPNIFGDTLVCEGQSLYLSTDNLTGVTYQWSNSSGNLSNLPSLYIPVVTLADSGFYYLTVSGNTCINSQGSVHVFINPIPNSPTIFGDTLYCISDTLILYSNNSSEELIWYDAQFNSYEQDSLVLTNLSILDSGNYYLFIQDNYGCLSFPDTIHISLLDAPTSPVIYNNYNYCRGDDLNIYTDSLQDLSYQWYGPDGFISTLYNNWILNINSNNSGIYTLIVTDSNGCSSNNSSIVTVYNYPIINLGNDTIICLDSLNNFVLKIDTIYDNYLWQDGSNNYYFNVLGAGLYFVTVQNGVCSTTDSIYVQVDSCLMRIIPNIFTPNGDGINDFFIIENIERFPNSKLEIFNRWGKLVYKSDNYKNNWDGNDLNAGTYYYIFYPNDLTGKSEIQKGYFSLIR